LIRYALLRTVLDPLLAVAGPEGLMRLEFLPSAWEYHTHAHALARSCLPPVPDEPLPAIHEDPGGFDDLNLQLAEYFTARRTAFDIPLDPRGTPFQMRVWRRLQAIPYGRTQTYGQIARQLRKPNATRAVGQAAGRNPLPILIPCHRVVGKGGSLRGFAAGITTKARLLRLEGHTLGESSRIEAPRLF